MTTDRHTRDQLTTLSVVTVCALVLGGSILLIARNDAARRQASELAAAREASAPPVVAARPRPPARVTTASNRAPVRGVVKARTPKRRKRVARRSRAS